MFKKLNPFSSIKDKTDEVVSNTENFIKNIDKQSTGVDTVSIMINGEKTEISQEDYNKLKEQNNNLKQKLKEEIKDSAKEYKESLKRDLKKQLRLEKSK